MQVTRLEEDVFVDATLLRLSVGIVYQTDDKLTRLFESEL